MRLGVVFSVLLLSACQVTLDGQPSTTPAPAAEPAPAPTATRDKIALFRQVVRRVEPVAERICQQERPRANCDFRIIIDQDRELGANAYQTLDDDGRPVIGFTVPLIADARNADELAFVLGHEAAHHIEGHIPQSQQQAAGGAIIGGILGRLGGLDADGMEALTDIGAAIGSRRYSKEFELEADRLGTIITARSGYNPVRGAEFFNRIPDPGDRFLGSHPPNAERIAIVRETAAGL